MASKIIWVECFWSFQFSLQIFILLWEFPCIDICWKIVVTFCHICFFVCLFAFFLSFLFFLGPFPWHIEVPSRSCSCLPTPGPQQHGIWAMSATYTTDHGNAGSLTHWAGPGIESATSWFLVGFLNQWATMGIPTFVLSFWNELT